MIKKISSQIRDIFQYKEEHPVVLYHGKQTIMLGFVAILMMAITMLIAFLFDDLNRPDFLFLMTNGIGILIYLTYLISNERVILSTSRIRYPLILGILPNVWSTLGPYVMATTFIAIYFNHLFGILVILVQILLMTALVISSVLMNSLKYVSFYRFFKSSVVMTMLLYLFPTFFEGLYFSIAYAIAMSFIVLISMVRYAWNAMRPSHPLYDTYVKFISFPVFGLLMYLAFLYSINMNSIQYHHIFPASPVLNAPNIEKRLSLTIEGAHTLVELPDGRIFARGTNVAAILDQDFSILYQFQGSFVLHQADPYILTEIRRDEDTHHTWKFNTGTLQLETLEHMHLYNEVHRMKIVEFEDKTYYIYTHPNPSLAYFDVYHDGSVERHSFLNEDGSHAFKMPCHLFSHDGMQYHYYHCLHYNVEMVDETTYRSVFYKGNQLIIEENRDGYPYYQYIDLETPDRNQDIQTKNQWIYQITKKDTSWLVMTSRYSVPICYGTEETLFRLNSNFKIAEGVLICSPYVSLVHGKVLIWDIERSDETSIYDVLDTKDMNQYVMKKNNHLGSYLFAPLFIIMMFAIPSTQFRRIPHRNRYTLFEENLPDQD